MTGQGSFDWASIDPSLVPEATPAPVAGADPWLRIFMIAPTGDRLSDIILQIRRDLAVLAGPAEYCPDRAFYEKRVERMRALAATLMNP